MIKEDFHILLKNSARSLETSVGAVSPLWEDSQVLSHLEKGHPYISHSVEGRLAAFILYVRFGEVVEICYLETLAAFRGQGVMSRLFSKLIRENPGRIFWLDVHEDNGAAIALYKKLGFENKGLRKGYYRDGGDGLLMERSLVS